MPNRLIYSKDTPLADSNITDLLKLHMGLGTTVIIEHTENRTGLNGEPFDILGRLYAFSEETEKLGHTNYASELSLTLNSAGALTNNGKLVTRIIIEEGVFEDYGMGDSFGVWHSEEWVRGIGTVLHWWEDVTTLFWSYTHPTQSSIGNKTPERVLAEKLGLHNWTLASTETVPLFKKAICVLQELTGAPDAALLNVATSDILCNLKYFSDN
jgi:hypothetical protein